MMLARFCSRAVLPSLGSTSRTSAVQRVPLPRLKNVRFVTNGGRSSFTRSARMKGAVLGKEKSISPASAHQIGAGVVAGASLVGIGALAYYGLGFSSVPGAIDRSLVWPQFVRDRIQSTYMYVGSSMLISVASASMILRRPNVLRFISQGGISATIASIALIMATSIPAYSMPYKKGLNAKHLAWLAHSAVIGIVAAPICFLGGPVILRAACYTAGIVLSLSTIAACAPSEQFLKMSGPLGIGLGVIFVSSMASMFLSPMTPLGASLTSLTFYGGLVLFSLLLLHDTQSLVRKAEMTPVYEGGNVTPFDPIQCALSLYLDIVHIFLRLAIMTGSNSKK